MHCIFIMLSSVSYGNYCSTVVSIFFYQWKLAFAAEMYACSFMSRIGSYEIIFSKVYSGYHAEKWVADFVLDFKKIGC